MPTVRRTRHDFEELERLLFTELPKESAAFALAGAETHRGGTDVIVRRPVAIPDAHFSIQGEYHLRIATAALNGLFDRQVRAFGRGPSPETLSVQLHRQATEVCQLCRSKRSYAASNMTGRGRRS